jgi:hypothetical protein
VIFEPLVSPTNNYRINDQSLPDGELRPCDTTTITVYDKKQ